MAVFFSPGKSILFNSHALPPPFLFPPSFQPAKKPRFFVPPAANRELPYSKRERERWLDNAAPRHIFWRWGGREGSFFLPSAVSAPCSSHSPHTLAHTWEKMEMHFITKCSTLDNTAISDTYYNGTDKQRCEACWRLHLGVLWWSCFTSERKETSGGRGQGNLYPQDKEMSL